MKTMIVVILICMLLLFLLKVPVYISMALTGCALMMATSGMKWSILTQYLYTGTNSFTLLAIPLFLLAAKLMNTGGITKKLFAFCMKVVGWLPGGLGHVNILSSVIFAGMSGTAVSDAGGLGAIEIKAMNENGFDNDFSCCVTAASSTMGPIIPPSIPLVVYATVSGRVRRSPVHGRYCSWNCYGTVNDGCRNYLRNQASLSENQIPDLP